jgi:hypothetical protein
MKVMIFGREDVNDLATIINRWLDAKGDSIDVSHTMQSQSEYGIAISIWYEEKQ